MAKSVIVEPVHDGEFSVFVKNSTLEDGWKKLDVPDAYLSLNNSVLTVDDQMTLSSSDDQLRLLIRFKSPRTIDRVYLEGISRSSGLTIEVYADDVAIPAVPATLIATRLQDAQSQRRRTANENISFEPVTKDTFMIVISGLNVAAGPYPTDLIAGTSGSLGVGEILEPTLMQVKIEWRVNFSSNSGFDPDVGQAALRIYDFHNSASIWAAALEGDSNDGIMTFVDQFWIDPSMNDPSPSSNNAALDFQIVQLIGSANPINPEILSVEIVSLATREKLSIEGVFFGVTGMEFADGHNWGVPHADFGGISFESSESQLFGSEKFVPRSMGLDYSHETNLGITQLRDLKYRLVDGFCLVDEDPDSDDPYTKILGTVEIDTWSNTNYNINSFRIRAQERKEWH